MMAGRSFLSLNRAKDFLFSTFVVLSVLSGCSANNHSGVCPYSGADAVRSVHVIRYSWHTGLLLERADLFSEGWKELVQLPGGEFLEFSWGDDDYYRTPDPGILLALKAALWPTDAVMHVHGVDSPSSYFSFTDAVVIEVPIDSEAFRALAKILRKSFLKDSDDRLQRIEVGLMPNSSFFKATGKFHLFRTCNTWTAQALQSASCPISPFMLITSSGLISGVKDFGRVIYE